MGIMTAGAFCKNLIKNGRDRFYIGGLFLFFLFYLPGCVSAPKDLSAEEHSPKFIRLYAAPYENVFAAAKDCLWRMDWEYLWSDEEKGIIRAKTYLENIRDSFSPVEITIRVKQGEDRVALILDSSSMRDPLAPSMSVRDVESYFSRVNDLVERKRIE